MRDRIIAALTDDLRRAPWHGSPQPLAGHCYVASEAFWHLAGGTASGLTPQVLRHEGASHWYLRAADGRVIDLTAGQFRTPVPYERGRGCGFLTRRPSKRAALVIRRVLEAA